MTMGRKEVKSTHTHPTGLKSHAEEIPPAVVPKSLERRPRRPNRKNQAMAVM